MSTLQENFQASVICLEDNFVELEHIISELFKIYFEKVQLQMRRVFTVLSRALDLSRKCFLGSGHQRAKTGRGPGKASCDDLQRCSQGGLVTLQCCNLLQISSLFNRHCIMRCVRGILKGHPDRVNSRDTVLMLVHLELFSEFR